jgi:decaprenyl-phosphate phosphoribosyltransferase
LRTIASAILVTARPRQWIKNLVVAAAPFAGGRLIHPAAVRQTASAVLVFSLGAAAVYLVNDVVDRERDQMHPTKRRRPVASGGLTVPHALAGAATLVLAGGALAWATTPRLLPPLAGYLGIAGAYSLWLRSLPIVDLAAVVAGFDVRLLAGGLATGVSVSRWALITTSFAALFLAAGKRYAELLQLGPWSVRTRPVMASYTPAYLRSVCTLASTMAIAAYSLWSFEAKVGCVSAVYLSIAPFTLTVLRYGLLLEIGAGQSPEDVLLRDHPFQLFALLWLAMYGTGVYGAC